jgi:hypothetical protein
MKPISDTELIILKNLEGNTTSDEKEALERMLETNATLRQVQQRYQKLRSDLKRKNQQTFGPFFAERIITKLKKRVQNIDYFILFFFKKYQLLVVGVLVALLTANIYLSDQLSFESVFGLEQESVDDILSIDLYPELNP